MPRLPSSMDVSQVSPRITADPGVRAPAQAFESGIGTAAQELAPAVEKISQVAIRQENRRDTVDRADKITRYAREAEEELRRLNTEADLSREEVLRAYGTFLSSRRTDLLNEHGGSADSRALLAVRLQDVESAAIGRAASISTSLGRQKVITAFERGLTPLATRAAEDPSRQNIDKLFLNLETHINDVRGALDPTEEENFRSAGREQITLSALGTLISRGRVETAAAMMDDPGIVQSLTPEVQRDVRRRIETIRFERDEVSRKITQAETFLGRPLRPEEREQVGLSLLGITPAKLTERDKRIQELVGRGIPMHLAQDLASKDVELRGPDNFGKFHRVNVVTNSHSPVSDEDSRVLRDLSGIRENFGDEAQTETETAEPRGRSLEEDVQTATGPFSKIRAGISNIIGPFVEGALFEDTTKSRQQVRTFNQTAKTGLVNNPKFPVAEQNIVKDLLPNPDAFFLDPDTARSNLKELKKFLVNSKSSKEKELKKGKSITSERRGDLADQISRIDELLTLMQTPKKDSSDIQADSKNIEAPKGIPKGSKLVGKSTRGNDVWLGPDGKRREVVLKSSDQTSETE